MVPAIMVRAIMAPAMVGTGIIIIPAAAIMCLTGADAAIAGMMISAVIGKADAGSKAIIGAAVWRGRKMADSIAMDAPREMGAGAGGTGMMPRLLLRQFRASRARVVRAGAGAAADPGREQAQVRVPTPAMAVPMGITGAGRCVADAGWVGRCNAYRMPLARRL